MAVAVELSVWDNTVGVGIVADVDADARADEGAIDDAGVTDEASQSPKPDRHPSPQKSGPEPQYSY